MFSEKEQKIVLFFYVPIMVMWGILYLCGYHVKHFGDPVGICIIFLTYIISLHSWEDKRECLKRCVLALAFTLPTIVLLWLTLFGFSNSCIFGVPLFVLLTRETKNVRQLYIISFVLLVLLVIFVVLIKIGLTPPENSVIAN